MFETGDIAGWLNGAMDLPYAIAVELKPIYFLIENVKRREEVRMIWERKMGVDNPQLMRPLQAQSMKHKLMSVGGFGEKKKLVGNELCGFDAFIESPKSVTI